MKWLMSNLVFEIVENNCNSYFVLSIAEIGVVSSVSLHREYAQEAPQPNNADFRLLLGPPGLN